MITAEQWRKLYIDALIEYDDNLCDKCKHDYKTYCNETCKDAFELIFKHDIEKRGECRDLEFATCPVMVNTPCHECILGDAHNAFELDESKVIEDVR